MDNKTLKLEIKNTSDNNIILVSLSYEGEQCISTYNSHAISFEETERVSKNIFNAINDFQNGSFSINQRKILEQNGRFLCDEFLTPSVKKEINQSDAKYLILHIDDHLVNIPFELIVLNDKFLCQKFAIGRQVSTRKKVHLNKRETKYPLSMWIVNNPTGDLPSAAKEGEAIFSVLKDTKAILSMDTEVTTEDIISNITNFDILHFAGHSDCSNQSPETKGWKLKDGWFTAEKIQKMTCNKPLPLVVFANACQSGRTNELDFQLGANKDSHGIANSFLLAGVKHYVGTLWNISDTTSEYFAKTFYQKLVAGESIGMATFKARQSLMNNKHDLSWASYLLYGDPRSKYVELQEFSDINEKSKNNFSVT